MDKFQSFSLTALRLVMGWMMLYAGLTKVLDPAWTAAGYLAGAKTLPGFFSFLASPAVLPFVNFMNAWGLTLLGVSLILGVFVRWSSILGALLMFFYYLPILDFPYPNPHAFIVDEHIIYIFSLLLLSALRAGEKWGLDSWLADKFPNLRSIIG